MQHRALLLFEVVETLDLAGETAQARLATVYVYCRDFGESERAALRKLYANPDLQIHELNPPGLYQVEAPGLSITWQLPEGEERE